MLIVQSENYILFQYFGKHGLPKGKRYKFKLWIYYAKDYYKQRLKFKNKKKRYSKNFEKCSENINNGNELKQ